MQVTQLRELGNLGLCNSGVERRPRGDNPEYCAPWPSKSCLGSLMLAPNGKYRTTTRVHSHHALASVERAHDRCFGGWGLRPTVGPPCQARRSKCVRNTHTHTGRLEPAHPSAAVGLNNGKERGDLAARHGVDHLPPLSRPQRPDLPRVSSRYLPIRLLARSPILLRRSCFNIGAPPTGPLK